MLPITYSLRDDRIGWKKERRKSLGKGLRKGECRKEKDDVKGTNTNKKEGKD